MFKFCNACGTTLGEDAKFCTNCGSPVTSASSNITSIDYSTSSENTADSTNINTTAENIFTDAVKDISNLFSYEKLGREFTGDLSYLRTNISRYIFTVSADSLNTIANSNMSTVSQKFSKINDNMTDENWQNIYQFLKNGVPIVIVSYFYNPQLSIEVRGIMNRLTELSKKRWEKTSILGKAAIPSVKFEEVFTLRYLVNNLKF